MPNPAAGLSLGGSLVGSMMQADATSSAAATQAGAAQAGIEEQRRQFNEIQKLLSPYVQAGTGAIGGFQPFQAAGRSAFDEQMALLGLAPETVAPPSFGGGGGGFFGIAGDIAGELGQMRPAARSEAELRNALIGQFTGPERTIYGGSAVGGDWERTIGGEVNEAGLAAAIQAAQAQDQAAQNAFQAQATPSTRYVGGEAGQAAQDAAIKRIEASPFFQNQVRQGEEALLQRASATGGLRGGNIQAALAQFRPQMLQQAIEKQYEKLGGIAGTGLGATEALYRGGQASATNQASQAGSLGANVATLLGQRGAAQAGGQLAGAAPFANLLNMPTQLAGMNYARTGTFGFPGLGGLFGGGGGGNQFGVDVSSFQTGPQ